jgi:hypothetical protein
MFDLLFAYFGPETMLPLASIFGAVGGVIMVFHRRILRLASRCLRILLRKEPRDASLSGAGGEISIRSSLPDGDENPVAGR